MCVGGVGAGESVDLRRGQGVRVLRPVGVRRCDVAKAFVREYWIIAVGRGNGRPSEEGARWSTVDHKITRI